MGTSSSSQSTHKMRRHCFRVRPYVKRNVSRLPEFGKTKGGGYTQVHKFLNLHKNYIKIF